MASFIRVVWVCALIARFDNHRLLKENELSWHTKTGAHCEKTAYEKMVEENQNRCELEHATIGDSVAVLVIDAQRGFTANNHVDEGEGGFHQQCIAAQNGKSDKSIANIVSIIEAVKKRKGLVVATKDYHPADHCSFYEHCFCKNRNTAETYAEKVPSTEAPAYTKNRYRNDFPPHCVGTASGEVQKGADADDWKKDPKSEFVPMHEGAKKPRQSETQLHHDIEAAMKDYDRSFIAYKGFDRDYESFGAFPMAGERAKRSVGAKLWLDSNKKEVAFNDKKNPPKEAFEKYIDDTSDDSFKPLESYLKEQGVKQLIVVGYVYDFCVKETAIGAVQTELFDTVTVFVDACRPAADGNCDGDKCDLDFLTDAGRDPRSNIVLGSKTLADITFKQLAANGVKQAKWRRVQRHSRT
eukprot:TRINITY_DN5801_c0_g1_i1.p1 TRINITY_DN5801_c0_g1~~TRINITY_DN5801_c0_g1_i1.p1  ORF type:complete len:430 (+),score=46.89 TRINITY_DN5801_c0_g1_i1:60-1292(+)